MGSFGSGVEEVVLKELPHPDPYKIPSEPHGRSLRTPGAESPHLKPETWPDRSLRTKRPESPDPILQKSSDNIRRTCMWPDEHGFR